MINVPSRTLRDYLSTLPIGNSAGVVGQNLELVTGIPSMGQAVPLGGTTGQVLGKLSNTNLDFGWTTAGVGDMLKSIYDPQNKNADAFARANQTGTQSAATITGLATVATTGAYANLSGLPTLGTAAAQNTTAFATAAQGALADSAVQPAATQTLTNKRVTPRFTTIASTATLTPNANTEDMTAVTAQAVALTIAAPTGTPTNGQTLTIRIKDNGVARTVAWNAAYSAFLTDDLRTTTVASKTLIFQFIYNATDTVWDLLHSNASLGIWS